MLLASESLTAGQDQLAIVYDHNPAAMVQTLALLARARDPYGVLPPAAANFSGLVDLEFTRSSLTMLSREIVESASSRYRDKKSDEKPAAENPLLALATWLTMGTTVALPRGYIFRDDQGIQGYSTVPPEKATAVTAALNALGSLNDSAAGNWLSAADVRHLSLLTLWSSFEKIRAHQYYSGAVEVPNGAQKESYAFSTRVRRLYGLVMILHHSIALAGLRERAAWLTSPAVRPMLEYAGPDVQEELDTLAAKILALKVHPWIAECERMRLPARRYTEWSEASHTFGLARGGLFNDLKAHAKVRGSGGSSAEDIRSSLILGGSSGKTGQLFPFIREAREVLQLREMLEPADLSNAEAVLNLTSSGSPPAIHLHGKTWRAFVMTGNMASEALPDLLHLLVRPRRRLAMPGGSTSLAGNIAALGYSARFWATGENTVQLMGPLLASDESEVPLFVEPTDPVHSDGYTLYQLTPEMIRAETQAEYFGDEDAQFAFYSPKGLATLLGFASDADMLASNPFVDRMSHLFTRGGTGAERAHTSAHRIFHSSRTRKTWRVRVPLAKDGMPTQTIAFNARTAPVIRDIEAVILRTPDLPSLPASTEALTDDSARRAVAGLGASEQR